MGGDRDPALAEIVARQLAVWMTYEDAIRVADLKTRASRFERIRREARVKDGEVEVTDFLKPDLDEIYGVLPYRLVAPFARWAERRWPRGRPTVGQRVKTTTILGFLRLWLLARLRPLRPVSYRAQWEHERMERWLTAVRRCAEAPARVAVTGIPPQGPQGCGDSTTPAPCPSKRRCGPAGTCSAFAGCADLAPLWSPSG